MWHRPCINALGKRLSPVSYRPFSTSKPKVLLTTTISKDALDLLKKECEVTEWGTDEKLCAGEDLKRSIQSKDGLFCILDDKIDQSVIEAAGSSLKSIATMSVGFDHIDLKECAKRKIAVGNTPGVLTETTAELAVGLMLAVTRHIPEGFQAVKEGTWKHWRPLWLCGRDIYGSTVGIMGLGRIGQATARRLKAFGCNLIYHGREPKPKEAQSLGAEYRDLDSFLKESDFISVHCPLTPDTRLMFNEKAFSKMKPTAVLVNTSRGAVVDQDALYKALKSGQIRAAALDVTTPEPISPQHPLLSLPNCLITPHIGSASLSTRGKMALMTAENLIAGLKGRPMPYPVNTDVKK